MAQQRLHSLWSTFNIRPLVTRFWALLDNDSVRPFISLYYIPWLIWSMFATVVLPPVTVLEAAMGHSVYDAWVWLTIPGTLFPMVGLGLRHGGSSVAHISTPLLFQDWMGLWMQATGHACMCILLLLFEISAVQGAIDYMAQQGVYAGMTIFVASILSSYVLGTFLLSMQCLRKIWKGEQLKAAA